MKLLTKAALGLGAAGAAYVAVQKRRNAIFDETQNRAEIHGFVSAGFEAVSCSGSWYWPSLSYASNIGGVMPSATEKPSSVSRR